MNIRPRSRRSRLAMLGTALAAICLLGAVLASSALAYEWEIDSAPMSSYPLTEEGIEAGSAEPTILYGKVLGSQLQVSCAATHSTGKIYAGGTAEESLELSGCEVVEPATCKVENGKITFHLMKSEQFSPDGWTVYERFEPKAGPTGTFASVRITSCAIAGSYPLRGSFPGVAPRENGKQVVQTLELAGALNGEAGTSLKLGSEPAFLHGRLEREPILAESWGYYRDPTAEPYEWAISGLPISRFSLTEEGIEAGSNEPTVLSSKVLGSQFKMSCATSRSTGKIYAGGTAEESLELSGCEVVEPATCKVENGKITFHLMKSEQFSPDGWTVYERFEPKAGPTGTFASVRITSCAIAGSYPLRGSFAGLGPQENGSYYYDQELALSPTFSSAAGTNLKLGSELATVEGTLWRSLVYLSPWGYYRTA